MQDTSKQRWHTSMKRPDSWPQKHPDVREGGINSRNTKLWKPGSKPSHLLSLTNYKPGALGKVTFVPGVVGSFIGLIGCVEVWRPVKLWVGKMCPRWAGFPSRCFSSKINVTQPRFHDSAGWHYLKDVQSQEVTSSERVGLLSGRTWEGQQHKGDSWLWTGLCQAPLPRKDDVGWEKAARKIFQVGKDREGRVNPC